jgi:polysaccharide export outer membrane protein
LSKTWLNVAIYFLIASLGILVSVAYAQEKAEPATDAVSADAASEDVPTLEQVQAMARHMTAVPKAPPALPDGKTGFDPLKYTLGPDDVVEVSVMRHPEFSGTYPINQEGKLQYKFVGDLQVKGLTKFQLEKMLREIIAKYVIEPEVNVTVTEYRSKVFYVLGEVGAPGRYYMRSETISVRDAIVMAGLPTYAAAMRKTRIITPDAKGGHVRNVDIYSLLYGGDLTKNLDLKPGDFLYVPATVMAKAFRVISPASSAVATAVSPVESLSTGKSNSQNLRSSNTNP